MLAPDYAVLIIVLVATATGLLTAAWFASRIALISIEDDSSSANARLINNEHKAADDNTTMSVPEIARAIADGANAFLYAEYQYAHTRQTQQACRAVVSTGSVQGGSSDGDAVCTAPVSDLCFRACLLLDGWVCS